MSVTSNGTVSFDGQPLTLQTGEFAAATQGEKFQAQMASVNGTPPYKYSATGFPVGLSIDEESGAVTGTPTEAGAFTPIITVTDSSGTPMTDSKSLPLAVAAEEVVEPTTEPTVAPTVAPTDDATTVPTVEPTVAPTADPTVDSTHEPTTVPATPAASVPAETVPAAATPSAPETSASPETAPAADKLPVTGAAAAIPAVVGALVLGAGLVLTSAMRRHRPRHN